MNKAIYDSIGINYNTNRTADPRIAEILQRLLNLYRGSTIADIGSGTGNYSHSLADSGYKIVALEPSGEMISQSVPNKNINWFSGTAESIPLSDDSVDGVISTLAIHHFNSIRKASEEMKRICPSGPAVIFTLDPRESTDFWFCNYFPEIVKQEHHSFPPIKDVAETVAGTNNWAWEISIFPLPYDLIDLNMRSGWNRPELYLDEHFRQNTSGLSLASEFVVNKGIKKLREDLDSGKWDREFGYLRKQKYFDAGFRFIKFRA